MIFLKFALEMEFNAPQTMFCQLTLLVELQPEYVMSKKCVQEPQIVAQQINLHLLLKFAELELSQPMGLLVMFLKVAQEQVHFAQMTFF